MYDLFQAEASKIPHYGMDLCVEHPGIEVLGRFEAPSFHV